jgi:hypothetical protein
VAAAGALVPVTLGCLLLFIAGAMDDPGRARLVAIFCCLVPGLLMGVASIFGGLRYSRQK